MRISMFEARSFNLPMNGTHVAKKEAQTDLIAANFPYMSVQVHGQHIKKPCYKQNIRDHRFYVTIQLLRVTKIIFNLDSLYLQTVQIFKDRHTVSSDIATSQPTSGCA